MNASGVHVYVCVCPQCLPMKERACPSEVLLFSPVLLPPAACLPPPTGWPRLPHADLFNCLPLPVPGGVCVQVYECVCVFVGESLCVACCAEENMGDSLQTHTHTHGSGTSLPARRRRHSVSVRYCRAHVANMCPIKCAHIKELLSAVWSLFKQV